MTEMPTVETILADRAAAAALAETEVQTRGPVIIDTTKGEVRDADTGERLLHLIDPGDPGSLRSPGFEVDVSLIYFGAWGVVCVLLLAAAALATIPVSLKFALAALALAAVAERLWRVISTPVHPTEPEGLLYASQSTQRLDSGPDDYP